MTAIMILISFLLNVLLIFAMILLFMRQNRFVEIEKKQRALLSESEELVNGLLAEIREENDRFLQQIMHVREKRENPPQNLPLNRGADEHADLSEETFDGPEKQETSQEGPSLRKQVEEMAAQGMTLAEIAKTLGKGKTEIELAMKFYRDA
ncbi:DUF6115 domain-containing protein [Siminovitchia sp. 179-K 8D1 HS]|uniref:DUF6115 domain-containing protein n=1 Tax=Siminovitchia sp. 179-K 8D1 HS TaxID=3142385 RepID=UPI0039A1CFCB